MNKINKVFKNTTSVFFNLSSSMSFGSVEVRDTQPGDVLQNFDIFQLECHFHVLLHICVTAGWNAPPPPQCHSDSPGLDTRGHLQPFEVKSRNVQGLGTLGRGLLFVSLFKGQKTCQNFQKVFLAWLGINRFEDNVVCPLKIYSTRRGRFCIITRTIAQVCHFHLCSI